MGRFHYLHVGLALVLAFVGVKMLLADVYKVPIAVSLGVIAALLGGLDRGLAAPFAVAGAGPAGPGGDAGRGARWLVGVSCSAGPR